MCHVACMGISAKTNNAGRLNGHKTRLPGKMAEGDHPIYPQYCFHLSETINKFCPLRSIDIESLTRHPGFGGMYATPPPKEASPGHPAALTSLQGKMSSFISTTQ